MKFDFEMWDEYKLTDVFALRGGYYNKKPEHSVEGKIPFLASTETHNGVTEYYSLEDIKTWDKVGGQDHTLGRKIYPGNCIAVTVNGSVCNAFYQKDPFTCSHDITALYPIDHFLSFNEAMFLCTIIMLEKYRWSYGRKPHDIIKFGKSIIRLPSTSNHHPDWKFMEEYVSSLHHKPMLTKNSMDLFDFSIKVENWMEFRLGDLFSTIYKAQAHVKADYECFSFARENTIPFISRTESHNGCDCYVTNSELTGIESGQAIVIGDTTATCSYQASPFLCGDHIVICRADWINTYTALFVVTLLRKEQYKYSYGRAFKMQLITETKIKLPTKNGKPDWTYMENYIKSLPYGDRI